MKMMRMLFGALSLSFFLYRWFAYAVSPPARKPLLLSFLFNGKTEKPFSPSPFPERSRTR